MLSAPATIPTATRAEIRETVPTPEPPASAAPPAGHYLAGLDGLRGLACLLVFAFHLHWAAGEPDLRALGLDFTPLLRSADCGVAIFFVLSGLLLSQPFWRSLLQGARWPELGPYLWRRACRIVPAYYACLAVIYLLREGTYTFYGFLDFLLHATFLHTFSEESYTSINGVLWSIGIEMQFYFLLPLLMAGVAWCWRKAGGWSASAALLLTCLLADLAARAVLVKLAPHLPPRFLIAAGGHVPEGTIFSYLKLFAIGIFAGFLVQRWPRQAGSRAATALGFVALAGLLTLLWQADKGEWRLIGLTGWPVNAILIGLLAAATPRSPLLARLFSLRALQFAGVISYGIYLWHDLVLHAVFHGTLPGRLQGVPLLLVGGALALGVTSLLAWLSFRYLEKPAIQSSYPFVSAA